MVEVIDKELMQRAINHAQAQRAIAQWQAPEPGTRRQVPAPQQRQPEKPMKPLWKPPRAGGLEVVTPSPRGGRALAHGS
jgi:hypothetical protein